VTQKLSWSKKYSAEDWIYRTNNDNTARFILGIMGENPLVCFGINPSTACPEQPDPTLLRVEKYAYLHGFDSWIMFNIYPQRATNPKDIHEEVNFSLHKENIKNIEDILSRQKLLIWAAWGNAISAHKHLLHCIDDIESIAKRNNCRWGALGTTSANNPVHPLYRAKGFKLYETELVPYSRT
jgi:hypothetical protein